MKKKVLLWAWCCLLFFAMTQAGFSQEIITKNSLSSLKHPPYLKVGDTVAIVAPSGVLKNKAIRIREAKALLKRWGLHAVEGAHLFSQNHHFAGTDAERCSDFQTALDDPSVRAIWCARGGYGAVRILDCLDWQKFIQQPKWVIGYSDITALHSTIHNLGISSIHGMMCSSMQPNLEAIAPSVSSLKKALFGAPLNYTLKASKYNKPGAALGQLVGGNLTLLQSLLESKSSLNTANSILFIEDIGEYKYHIDRMLQSLKRAGYFEHCNGVIVGDMSKMRKNTTAWGSSVEQLILDVLADYDFPVAFHMPAGHETDNRAMIFGRLVKLAVKKTGTSLVFYQK